MTETSSRRRPTVSVFAVGVIFAAGAVVSAASSLFLGQKEMWRRHASLEAGQIPWVVFLKDGADRAPIEETLRVLPGLGSLRFVSKEEALETAKADPAFSAGLSLTGGNPFPESFVVQWNPLFVRADLLDHHARRVAALPGVDHVDCDRPRVERFAMVQKALSQTDLAVETLAALAVALLLVFSGRLLFFSREAFSPAASAADLGAALSGAAAGVFSARFLGLPPDAYAFLAGTAAAAVLALAAFAL